MPGTRSTRTRRVLHIFLDHTTVLRNTVLNRDQTVKMAPAVAQSLPLDVSSYPKLSTAQVGHLRHFYNLAFQLDGEWNHMGAQE
jgi:hypothetical protein